ncbi:MAG: dTMP kinase [Alphaproteobacteria bacterium]|nr:dTMP kinase [Alphaproteobacteria bacterium]
MKGRFITFEGGEGTGKTTQIKMLAEYLQSKGIEVVLTKEPGGTPIGQELRTMLCTGDKDKFDAVAEALLYYADRRIHLQQKILPALVEGKWVISDRFADSTMAYQYYGYNKRVPKQTLEELYKMTVGDFYPDMTVILDINPEIGLARSMARNNSSVVQETRHESRGLEFHNNLRNGFLEIAKTSPRYNVLNADKTIDELHNDIIKLIDERLLNA